MERLFNVPASFRIVKSPRRVKTYAFLTMALICSMEKSFLLTNHSFTNHLFNSIYLSLLINCCRNKLYFKHFIKCSSHVLKINCEAGFFSWYLIYMLWHNVLLIYLMLYTLKCKCVVLLWNLLYIPFGMENVLLFNMGSLCSAIKK